MGYTCGSINCTNGETATPDPDIAGIGVVLAFLISAWLTFAVALFTYNLVEGVDSPSSPESRLLDLRLRKAVWKLLKKTIFGKILSGIRSRVSRDRMKEVCLMLSDQQLVTGVSIIIVAYAKHCTMTQYHFYIAANLTLVSFATYQSVLLLVRDKIQENNMARGWRSVWIMAVFGCVLVINFVLYNENFPINGRSGLPMQCVWNELPQKFTGAKLAYVVFGVLVDVSSAYAIMLILYPELKDKQVFVVIERKCGRLMRQPTSLYRYIRGKKRYANHWTTRWWWQLFKWPSWALCLVSFTLREIFTSLYWDMVRIFLYLFSSTLAIIRARQWDAPDDRTDAEDNWSFGQILPLLFLALPLLSFAEAIFDQSSDEVASRIAEAVDRLRIIRRIPLQGLKSQTKEEKFEKKMSEKDWFGIWISCVWFCLFGLIVVLTIILPNGVPR
ncbi:hypothetical protein G7054_g12658 [Neopestalotiopsis clavispora]|nr:hypothetical protein G7054_g12658 [Neopestalotiopsis clavispora]